MSYLGRVEAFTKARDAYRCVLSRGAKAEAGAKRIRRAKPERHRYTDMLCDTKMSVSWKPCEGEREKSFLDAGPHTGAFATPMRNSFCKSLFCSTPWVSPDGFSAKPPSLAAPLQTSTSSVLCSSDAGCQSYSAPSAESLSLLRFLGRLGRRRRRRRLSADIIPPKADESASFFTPLCPFPHEPCRRRRFAPSTTLRPLPGLDSVVLSLPPSAPPTCVLPRPRFLEDGTTPTSTSPKSTWSRKPRVRTARTARMATKLESFCFSRVEETLSLRTAAPPARSSEQIPTNSLSPSTTVKKTLRCRSLRPTEDMSPSVP
eukprot:scaffold2675_cov236-Pinguiococcus_pyrenoidosus.AAC.5